MTPQSRSRNPFLFILLAILVIGPTLLAVGMRTVEFEQTRAPFPSVTLFEIVDEEAELPPVAETESGPMREFELDSVVRTVTWAYLIGGIAMLFVLATSKEGRSRLLVTAIQFTILGVAVYLLRDTILDILSSFGLAGLSEGQGEGQAEAPPMPVLFGMLLSVPIALVLTFIGWRIWLRFRPEPSSDTVDFTDEIRSTIDQLDAGANLRQTILECYRAMLEQARSKRLIHIDESATTIELERSLLNVGLPQNETRRLSRLFEQVRYGQHEASERERLEARDCLVNFIAACERQ